MITKLEKIDKVGCFEQLTTSNLRPFSKVNIVFGNNGSGKTTFSNLLYLISKHCKDKKLLFEELTEQDSKIEILTDNIGKVTMKNIINQDQDIYVFNSKFVADSVYDGNTSKIDSFSNEIQLTNESIKILDQKIKILTTRYGKIENWSKEIQTILDNLYKLLADEFQSKVSNARLTGVKPLITSKVTGNSIQLREDLDKLYSRYNRISKQSVTISKLEKIKDQISLVQNLEINLSEAKNKLKTPINQDITSDLQTRINTYKAKIEKKNVQPLIGDLDDWYKKGGRLLHISKEIDTHCPLCNSNLNDSIDEIIEDFSNHYSDAIVKLLDYIDNSVNHLNSCAKKNFLKQNQIISNAIIEDASKYDIEIDNFTFNKNDLLSKALQILKNRLESKKGAPNESLLIDQEDYTVITEYQKIIDDFKQNSTKSVDDAIASLKEESLDEIIKEIKSKIKEISSAELNQSDRNIFISKNKTNSDIASGIDTLQGMLNEQINDLQTIRSEEIAKLNAESKFVNLYLNHFGITHFSIRKLKDRDRNNIVITFKKTGRKKDKFGYSLSEGEKTALAFAYFISKLRVEKLESGDSQFENSIIVIDDPISSLDENRIFQTANLIDSFLFFNKEDTTKQPNQVFILSHNLVFVKYIYNAFRTNKELNKELNEYYISNLTPNIIDLPSSLKNFTNTYISKLKTIIDFNGGKLEYDDVKNYLPNYIRIVLETFLAFKLARVNDGDKLPGLDYLIKSMIIEFKNYEDKEVNDLNQDKVIERLNHLKKVSDHESHGSIYKAEEFVFISEHELKQFAKHTIQVIGYIDELHFNKVKGHS